MLTLWIWRSLPLMASISFSVDRFADALAIQDEVARDAPDRAEDRFRQANEQALAVDAVDRCPVLPDQHSAAVKLFLRAPVVIFEQEVRLVLGDGVEQLGEEAGDTIFLGRVLVRGASGPSVYPLAFFSRTSFVKILVAVSRFTGSGVFVPVLKVDPRRPKANVTRNRSPAGSMAAW